MQLIIERTEVVWTFNGPNGLLKKPTRVTRDRNAEVDALRVNGLYGYDVSAPCCGRVVYRITKIDERGAWGVLVSNTVRELTRADVI